MLEFTTLEAIKPGESSTICLFGDSGTGKTWLCGTADPLTSIFINIGNGRETLTSPLFREKNPNSQRMRVIDIFEKYGEGGIPESAKAFDMLTDTMDELLKMHDVKTIIIDDLTAISRAALVKGMEVNQSLNKSKSLAASKTNAAMISGIQDYGMEMTMITWFTSSYTSMCKERNINLLITALPLRDFKKGENIGDPKILTRVLPRVTGKYAPDFPGFFDDVWYMEQIPAMQGVMPQIRTRGDSIVYAKTRHAGVFKDVEQNPNLAELLNRIKTGNLIKR